MIKKSVTYLFIFLVAFGSFDTEAKKIKNSFKIEKENINKPPKEEADTGFEISLTADPEKCDENRKNIAEDLRKISFAGYEKEVNSSKESFILVNGSKECIIGFTVRIDYLDMNGRMLHSRDVKEKCRVPSGENRKLDIGSWDTQKTYYYHLGNAPKKTATPFKVRFTPLSFTVER